MHKRTVTETSLPDYHVINGTDWRRQKDFEQLQAMADEEADPELLELLRQSLGLSKGNDKNAPPETGVLASAEYIYNNSIDVALDMAGTKAAAARIRALMSEKQYSTLTWSTHELHPKTRDEAALNFIFTMDLLNFSFWSELTDEDRFCVDFRGQRWTGYWSLVAALQRALEEGLNITSPSYWHREAGYSDDVFRHVFRSATAEPIPMLDERIKVLREAADVLFEHFEMSPAKVLERANHSAAGLVNLLAEHFPSFRDETRFEGRRILFMKRAQIFAADVWACFNGEGPGFFNDIEKITMFAGKHCTPPITPFVALLTQVVGNRLPHPSDPAQPERAAVLPTPRSPDPQAATPPTQLTMGDRAARLQRLRGRADPPRDQED